MTPWPNEKTTDLVEGTVAGFHLILFRMFLAWSRQSKAQKGAIIHHWGTWCQNFQVHQLVVYWDYQSDRGRARNNFPLVGKKESSLKCICTCNEPNASRDWTPRLILFCIGLTSGENKTLDIRFGIVCTPQLAAKVEVHTKTIFSQGKEHPFIPFEDIFVQVVV